MKINKLWLDKCLKAIQESAAEAQIAASDMTDAGHDVDDDKLPQAIESMRKAIEAANFSLAQLSRAIAIAEEEFDGEIVERMKQACVGLVSMIAAMSVMLAKAELALGDK